MAKKAVVIVESPFHIPPSQQSCQGPVPKPGEPIKPTKGILAEPKLPQEPLSSGTVGVGQRVGGSPRRV